LQSIAAARLHHGSSPLSDRSISSQTNRTNSTLSFTCSRIGMVFALRYRACRSRNAAMRQAFSSHHSLGGYGDSPKVTKNPKLVAKRKLLLVILISAC
jgi:hypothetical protein